MAEPRTGNTPAAEEAEEASEGAPEHHPSFQPLRLEQVSAALRAALLAAPVGATGMRSVRAIGPAGQRYSAGLFGENVYVLELPWPNPHNECRSLRQEPAGIQWQPTAPGRARYDPHTKGAGERVPRPTPAPFVHHRPQYESLGNYR